MRPLQAFRAAISPARCCSAQICGQNCAVHEKGEIPTVAVFSGYLAAHIASPVWWRPDNGSNAESLHERERLDQITFPGSVRPINRGAAVQSQFLVYLVYIPSAVLPVCCRHHAECSQFFERAKIICFKFDQHRHLVSPFILRQRGRVNRLREFFSNIKQSARSSTLYLPFIIMSTSQIGQRAGGKIALSGLHEIKSIVSYLN